VGYHGFALNVANSLEQFAFIHPCGFRDIRMTSVAEQLGPRAPSLDRVRATVTAELVTRLGFEGFTEVRAADVWALAGIARPADTSKQERAGTGPRPIGGAQAW
jgi:hypothetical protein